MLHVIFFVLLFYFVKNRKIPKKKDIKGKIDEDIISQDELVIVDENKIDIRGEEMGLSQINAEIQENPSHHSENINENESQNMGIGNMANPNDVSNDINNLSQIQNE